MCFLWIHKKDYLLTLVSCFLKISTLQAFNCKKSSSQKIPGTSSLFICFTKYIGDIF